MICHELVQLEQERLDLAMGHHGLGRSLQAMEHNQEKLEWELLALHKEKEQLQERMGQVSHRVDKGPHWTFSRLAPCPCHLFALAGFVFTAAHVGRSQLCKLNLSSWWTPCKSSAALKIKSSVVKAPCWQGASIA